MVVLPSSLNLRVKGAEASRRGQNATPPTTPDSAYDTVQDLKPEGRVGRS
jgi:hypothetical protein